MTATTDHVQQAKRAVDQIRDALATLNFAADGHYEDEASAALDALDWLEEHLGLHMLDLRSHEPPRNTPDQSSDRQDDARAERRAGERDERLMP